MAIEDSSPERRNLTVTAIAFVLYYYGGGKFDGGQVSLEVINLTFTNYAFLGAFAWTMLAWFTLRYWQTTRDQFGAAFAEESRALLQTPRMIEYLHANVKWPEGAPHAVTVPVYLTFHGLEWSVTYRIESPGQGGAIVHNSGTVYFEGWYGRILALRLMAMCAWSFPAVGAFLAPYALLVGASWGPVFARLAAD